MLKQQKNGTCSQCRFLVPYKIMFYAHHSENRQQTIAQLFISSLLFFFMFCFIIPSDFESALLRNFIHMHYIMYIMLSKHNSLARHSPFAIIYYVLFSVVDRILEKKLLQKSMLFPLNRNVAHSEKHARFPTFHINDLYLIILWPLLCASTLTCIPFLCHSIRFHFNYTHFSDFHSIECTRCFSRN